MSFLSRLKLMRSGKIPQCSAVIAAAGCSERMNGEDKLFIEINGAPVLAHALCAFQKCRYINEIIIVAREECIDRISDICKQFCISKAEKIIFGGSTRLLSVLNGVFAVSKKSGIIAIHDGARPCIDQIIIERAIESAAEHHAAAPAVPISSTIKNAERSFVKMTIDREGMFEIQTPQVFTADLIKAALTNAYKKSIQVTDDCQAVEILGAAVHLTEGSRCNIKLTSSEDVTIVEAILAQRSCATGNEELGVHN